MTFTPTTANEAPAVCFCCGREATGIGLGAASRSNPDPRWLCEDCVAEGRLLTTAARNGRAMTHYEGLAVERAIASVGPMVEEYGSDLGEWDEAQVQRFVGAVWMACGAGLREVIASGEVPF